MSLWPDQPENLETLLFPYEKGSSSKKEKPLKIPWEFLLRFHEEKLYVPKTSKYNKIIIIYNNN